LAAESSHLRTLQKLWECAEKQKLNVKNDLLLAKDREEKTALHIAAENGQLDTVKFLVVEKGADVHAKTDIGGKPLYLAARAGNEDADLLLQNGGKVTAQNDYDEKALHEAARTGKTKVVELLLKSEDAPKAIQLTTCSDDTSLQKATINGHEEVVKILLKKDGINVDAKNYKGETALHMEAR